ncbi:hypothetical protein RND81_10G038800 [Saponaria officinalis]|uniref:Uncharacterized protein n=1 Tax=Saponaria officinalis TaxID=3572 RepID=A0AAW1HY01_SAPOF
MSELHSDNRFRPCIVSIGITHSPDPTVVHMQAHKWVYMNSLLSRTFSTCPSSCVDAITDLDDESRHYFGSAALGVDTLWLLKLLILDGCFILELLIQYYSKLFNVVTGRDTSLPHDLLAQMVTVFFQPSYLDKPRVPVIERKLHRAHLLNLLLNMYRPTTEVDVVAPPRRLSATKRTFLLNATSLDQVGVKFKSHAKTSSLLDIKFKEGIFEIPTLHISKWTDSFFRNMIAFERCCTDRKPYAASRGILVNDLRSDYEILVMFNRIGRQFGQPEYFYYQEMCDLVDSSYNKMWFMYKSQLEPRYFRSPMAMISIICAAVLVTSTVLHTVNTVLGYYKRKHC